MGGEDKVLQQKQAKCGWHVKMGHINTEWIAKQISDKTHKLVNKYCYDLTLFECPFKGLLQGIQNPWMFSHFVILQYETWLLFYVVDIEKYKVANVSNVVF